MAIERRQRTVRHRECRAGDASRIHCERQFQARRRWWAYGFLYDFGGFETALTQDRGRDAKVIDWLDELTATCPKKIAHNMNDPCGARCPQLPKVL